MTTSIGVASGSVGDKPGDLPREADLAMFWAKKRGKARHEVSPESPNPI